jgi:hypothetical protein
VRTFVVTVLVSTALVVAINSAARLDRSRQDERIRTAAAALQPGLAMVFEGFVDERRFQKARLEVIPHPRLTAFGSSRVREVSSALLHARPGEFYNLGMSAAAVEDYIALWSLIEERGIWPRVAVFAVDAWVFNASHEQRLWRALAPEVSRFVDGSASGLRGRWRPVQGALAGWDQAKELVSYTVLQSSLRDLERTLTRRKRHGDGLLKALGGPLVPEDAIEGRHAIRADGSVIRPPSLRDPIPAEVREAVLRHVATGPYGLVDFRWNSDAAAALERLWRDMRARGVDLVVYAPPYHPAAWEALRRAPRYRAALDSSGAALTRLAGAVGARFLDASDPAAVPCSEAEFYDMQHATPACLGRLWARLLPSSLVSTQLHLAPPATVVANPASESWVAPLRPTAVETAQGRDQSAPEAWGPPDADVHEEVAQGAADLHHVLPAEGPGAPPFLGRVDPDGDLDKALPGAQELDQDLGLVGEARGLDGELLEVGGPVDDRPVIVADLEAEQAVQQPDVDPGHGVTGEPTHVRVDRVRQHDLGAADGVEGRLEGVPRVLVVTGNHQDVVHAGQRDPLLVHPAQVSRGRVVGDSDMGGVGGGELVHDRAGAVGGAVVEQ